MTGALRIVETGLLATVQDRGRVGVAHLGVPRSGALDAPAAALGNRLVGNGPDAAVVELLLGGLDAVNDGPGRWAALTGAPAPATLRTSPPGSRAPASGAVAAAGRPAPAATRLGPAPEGLGPAWESGGSPTVRSVVSSAPASEVPGLAPELGRTDIASSVGRGRALPIGEAFWWPSGAELRVGRPADGVRTYLAVAGGIDVEPVLGSRSTDTLAWVGPPRVEASARVPLGVPAGEPRASDVPPVRRRGPLRVLPGPQDDWFADAVLGRAWTVRAESDRVGLRLDGPPLARTRTGELPSEGMVLGAVQVPPDGRPIVFLADHPPTGGYPVIGVVHPEDLWHCAQLRPGEPVRFAAARRG